MCTFGTIVFPVAALTASLSPVFSSRAQCTPDWVPGAAYPGIYGGAGDSVLWDPDGPGQEPEMLVITGEFDAVGGVHARNVAGWDGAQWRAFGFGFGGRSSSGDYGPHYTHLLTVCNGELYAGVGASSCSPFRPGCTYGVDILRWDGSDWVVVTSYGGRGGGGISAFGAYEGQLVVAGSFADSDGVPAQHIARWNGKEWLPLGTSPNDGIDGTALDLVVHDGRLIVAGQFSSAGGVPVRNVASWDGEVWSALGQGLGSGVSNLAVYRDELVAGGFFDASSGDPEHIARWDGVQWLPLGTGVGGVECAQMSSLVVYSDELVVGGCFDEAGGVPAPGAASWNGTEWRSWGAGMESVFTFGVCQGSLLAGGLYSTPGGLYLNTIGRWDGVSWNFFGDGLSARITALTPHNDDLIAAMDSDWQGLSSCNVRLPSTVSRWDGECWNPLETRDPNEPGAVAVMASFGTDLVVGGRFATMDGVSAANIARWDGVQWHALGAGLGVPNGSVDPIVKALAVFEGSLIAGGTFRTTGASPVERIARWNGTEWVPMGAGFPNSFPGTPFVAALVVHNGELFAGGRFDLGGMSSGVARWDPKVSAWEPILPLATINDYILALAVYADDLIAGGIVAGKSTSFVPILARWDGADWHTLGGGLGPEPDSESSYAFVSTLAVNGSTLIAGGRFARADGAAVNNIARWDGTRWHAMGSGVTLGFDDPDPYSGAAVHALTFHAGTLVVGGNFLRAGDHPSAYFAQWRCPACPADFNTDSRVTSQDFFDFLTAFFNLNPAADFNSDAVIDSRDFFDFLAAFFAGCP